MFVFRSFILIHPSDRDIPLYTSSPAFYCLASTGNFIGQNSPIHDYDY